MELDVFVTPGLGDNSYVLVSGDEAAVIDPQRDVERFVEAAASRGARITSVVETHVHNDYVSGAAELRAATGAEVVGPVDAGYAFGYRAVGEGDVVRVGDTQLVALSTPGHTYEHTSYLLREGDDGRPAAVFSGGSLMVGSAGRTDLLGDDHTDALTRLQYRTVRRLAELEDDVALLPTHGAGSFCAAAPPGDRRTSSMGLERASNPALAPLEEAEWVRRQLTGLAYYPDYYARMAPINRSGPRVFGAVPLPRALSPDDVASMIDDGAWLVDARDGRSFADRHVPGSINVPLERSFGAYVGWLVPFGARLVLSVGDHGALVEAATQLFRIGYEAVEGHLQGGIDAWTASGRATASYPTIEVGRLAAEMRDGTAGDVVDVRQPSEWDEGHLPGSRFVFVGDVPDRLAEFDPATRSTIVCASGYRSSMAASVLARAGVPVRLVARGGVPAAMRLLPAG